MILKSSNRRLVEGEEQLETVLELSSNTPSCNFINLFAFFFLNLSLSRKTAYCLLLK